MRPDVIRNGLSTGQFPVSAYVGSPRNLKDLKSDAPRSSLYAPPHFLRNQPVPATYSGQLFKCSSVVPEGISRNRNTLSDRGVTASRVSILDVQPFWVKPLL